MRERGAATGLSLARLCKSGRRVRERLNVAQRNANEGLHCEGEKTFGLGRISSLSVLAAAVKPEREYLTIRVGLVDDFTRPDRD